MSCFSGVWKDELARMKRLIAGRSVPLINAQDTVLDLMRLYGLPEHVEGESEP